MVNIYEVFNTSSDYEFSKFLDKLNLNTNELLNLSSISENNNISLQNKRQKILELMAGSADGNYEICLEQFNKIKKERILKENSFQQLNLNQIMELNQLVEDVAKKLKAPKCMQGIFNIIKTKSNANVANTFLGMVQQSQVNDSNLKFNTELQVNGQNLAQLIYQMKNDIEMFVNSVDCPKEETKKEIKENNEGLSITNRIAGIYNIKNGNFKILSSGQQHNLNKNDYEKGLVRYGIQDTDNGKICYITAWNEEYAWNARKQIYKKYSNINIDRWHLEFFTVDGNYNGKKMSIDYDSNGNQINESSVRKVIPIEQTISSIKTWVNSVNKPSSLQTLIQMIDEYMAVSKNNIQANTLAHLKSIAQTKLNKMNNESPKVEECVAQKIVSSACEEDTFNGLLNSLKPTMISITVNKETGDLESNGEESCLLPEPCVSKYPEPVQSLTISPTAIDAPILKKPDAAMATSAMTALASHINCIKSDSRENNIEELETINTLLNQLSEYFNSVLSESVEENGFDSDIDNAQQLASEFSKYMQYIRYIEEVVDIAETIYNNDSYLKALHTNLLIYLDSLDNDNLDMNDWKREPSQVIAKIIDENTNIDSPKRQAFIIHELSNIFYNNMNKETIDIIKNYVEASYDLNTNDENDEDYWDGEDETLKEEVNNINAEDYKQFIGEKIKSNTDEYYTIIDVFRDHFNLFFKIQEDNTNKILLATIPELKQYFNLDVNNYKEPEDYWDGEDELEETINSEKLFKNDDAIARLQNEIIRLKQKLKEPTSNKNYYNVKLSYAETKLRKLLAKNDEIMNEDTVFDHSWYEVEGQKYPKRTKEGVIIKENLLKSYKDIKVGDKFFNNDYPSDKAGEIISINQHDNIVRFNYKIGSLVRTLSYKDLKNNFTKSFDNKNDEDYWDGEDELEETCSAGANCAANVSGFAKPLGSKSKKRKTPSVDVEMFKESINNNIPCAIVLKTKNGYDVIKYNIFDNKGYLFVNEGIVKALTKSIMIEAVDDIYNECLTLPIYEGINPYQFELLLEDDLNNNTIITPQEKQKQEQELDNEIKSNPQLKVGITDDTSSQMIDNQELVGVDDSNLQDKKYIVKDPTTGKIKVVNSSQIKIMKNNNGVQ